MNVLDENESKNPAFSNDTVTLLKWLIVMAFSSFLDYRESATTNREKSHTFIGDHFSCSY
jgi:hypothetical protein